MIDRSAVTRIEGKRGSTNTNTTDSPPADLSRIKATQTHVNGQEIGLYTAPELEIPSPVFAGHKITAPTTEYSDLGIWAQNLAKRLFAGITEELTLFEMGGTQALLAHPLDPTKAIKVFDPDRVWEIMRAEYAKKIAEAKKAGDLGLAQKYAQDLTRLKNTMTINDRVPPVVYKIITAAIQRHKVLGKELRENVLPLLLHKMGSVTVTMVEEFQSVDRQGRSIVELVKLGQVAGAPKGTQWIDANKYIKHLQKNFPDSPQLKKLRTLERRWNEAMREFNHRLLNETHDANKMMGLNLTKAGQRIGFDLGTPGDDLANVFVKLGPDGEPLEIKIFDY